MVRQYYDAMAICRWAGPPDLFITITCNPNWNEIQYVVARILELSLQVYYLFALCTLFYKYTNIM